MDAAVGCELATLSVAVSATWHADNGTPIMDANRLQEVTEITEYANKFHHDTNPAWEAEHISDAELRHFSDRVLSFVSH